MFHEVLVPGDQPTLWVVYTNKFTLHTLRTGFLTWSRHIKGVQVLYVTYAFLNFSMAIEFVCVGPKVSMASLQPSMVLNTHKWLASLKHVLTKFVWELCLRQAFPKKQKSLFSKSYGEPMCVVQAKTPKRPC